MKKKIIGYKLIKPEYEDASLEIVSNYTGWKSTNNLKSNKKGISFYTDSNCEKALKKAGVLDLWFEPVYEEEFKVGDWVVVLPEDTHYENSEGCAQKIIEINDLCSLPYALSFKNGGRNSYSQIRKATKEEIEEAQTIVVDMGSFKLVIKGNKVYHKYEDITDYVIELVEYFGYTNVTPECIRNFGSKQYLATIEEVIFSSTGCENCTTKVSDWIKVYSIINNNK